MVLIQTNKLGSGVVLIGQSGGPTGVVNATLESIVRRLKENGAKTVLGAEYGIDGIKNRRFYDMLAQSEETLVRVGQSPGMALGSKRQEPTEEDCKKIVQVFKEIDVRYFFFIGGDNTARSTMLISNHAQAEGYELCAFHVPKTIDNDILVTDHTPGFGTAARYVARVVLGVEMDNRALPGFHVLITMGKDAGFLAAAAAAIEKVDEKSGPHKIYVPEKEFSIEIFLRDVENTMAKFGRSVFVVAEGIKLGAQKTTLVEHLHASLDGDGFGGATMSGTGAIGDYLVKLVKTKLNVKRVRQDTLGYSQRCFVGNISKVDRNEAIIAGAAAVNYAVQGYQKGSVALNSLDGRENGDVCETQLASLALVGSGKKIMPIRYLSEHGNGITPAGIDYIAKLMGGKPWVAVLEPIFWQPPK